MLLWPILLAVLLTVSIIALSIAGRVQKVTVLCYQPVSQAPRHALSATVIPNRVAPPPQQLGVTLWTPPRIKGELEQ